MNDELRKALMYADFSRAEELLVSGADINACDDSGESHLLWILDIVDDSERLSIVRFMLDHGADPRLVSSEGYGPLWSAAIAQDTDVLRVLLAHGADPNREVSGFETVYDYAECDYRFETFDINKIPEEPTADDKATEETWLQFLDRVAQKHGKRRPDYVILLREHGAKTYSELHPNATGSA